MNYIQETKKLLIKGKEGILLGAIAGFGGWYLLLKNGVDMTFALVDQGLLDKVITTTPTTLAEYKVLIAMILIGMIIGFYLDISGTYKKYVGGNK